MIETIQLCCPKCKCKTFTHHYAKIEDYYGDISTLLGKSKSFDTPYNKCTRCGWTDTPLNRDMIKERIKLLLNRDKKLLEIYPAYITAGKSKKIKEIKAINPRSIPVTIKENGVITREIVYYY